MTERAAPVLHVSTPLTWRGGEQQVVTLLERLHALGIPQLLVCPPGSAVERAADARGLRHAVVRRRASVDLGFARGLARAAEREGARIVHAHDAHAHTAAVLARTFFGMRADVVLHRRVVFPVGRGAFSRWKWRHPAIRRVLCVSAAIARAVSPAVRDPALVRVVPDGIEPSRFSGARDGRFRRELGIPVDDPLVGAVGALTAEKDPLAFVRAAARIARAAIPARFVLVGEGPLRDKVRAEAARLGIGERLVLAGFRDDVPAILPELDVLLFASRAEGFGSTILEAFASRVAVVATRAGGIPEVVGDDGAGLLVGPGDVEEMAQAVMRLLRDGALRARVAAEGKRRVGEFTAARMAERTLAVYREVLAERA